MDNSIALVILSWITVVSSVVSYHPPMILSVIMSVYFANEIITSYVLVQEKFYKGDDSDSESDTQEDYSDLPPLIPISELHNTSLRSRFNRDRNIIEQLRLVETEVAARNAEKEQDAAAAAAAYQEAALKAEGEAAEMLNNLGNALMAEHMAKHKT